jgi:acetylornithine deacetylase
MPTPPLADRDLLARLVAFDTTSHLPTRPLVDFLCEYLDRPGVVVARQPADGGDKLNLLVRVGPPADAATRGGLVLSGHLDVVPAGDAEVTLT